MAAIETVGKPAATMLMAVLFLLYYNETTSNNEIRNSSTDLPPQFIFVCL